jgi:hypothetical protein
MKKIGTVGMAIVMALGLAGCGASPSGTVKEFYENVEKGKLDDAMEPLPPQAKAMGPEKIKAELGRKTSQIQAKGGIKSIKVVTETETGDVATVEIAVTYGDKSTANESIKMMKSDGKWLMQNGF